MTMTKERIINRLERNVKHLKNAYTMLHMPLKEGKEKYGSVAEYRKVKENVRIQIQTLNSFLEWIYNEENSVQEVPMFQQSDSKTNTNK